MPKVERSRLLRRMGIDEAWAGALQLLPIVGVAWADGVIQPGERAKIDALAAEDRLPEPGRALVADWMTHAPSPFYLYEGVRLLSEGPQERDQRAKMELRLARMSTSEVGWFRAPPPEVTRAVERTLRALGGYHGEPPAPAPDFVLRKPIVSLADEPDQRSPTLVSEIASHRSERIPPDGTSLGRTSRLHRPGDVEVAREHARITRQGGVWYAVAADGPLWINGERSQRRALLGGEILRLSAGSAFWFRLPSPQRATSAPSGRAAAAPPGARARDLRPEWAPRTAR